MLEIKRFPSKFTITCRSEVTDLFLDSWTYSSKEKYAFRCNWECGIYADFGFPIVFTINLLLIKKLE